MVKPKISLICPVYKAESYLDRCITSIIKQTFVQWELLLIDDGSPDSSGQICEKYAKQDSRIIVRHKHNAGVSAARQEGMDHATGEYLIHIDPDDWIEPNMLEELCQKADSENFDIVICDFYEDTQKSCIIKKQEPSNLASNIVFRELFSTLHGSCCNKLVKRNIFERYCISFPEGYVYLEDLYVNLKLCSNDIKIGYLPKAFYHYIQDNNPNSLVHKPTRKKVESLILFCKEFENDMITKGLYDDIFHYKYEAKIYAMQSGCYNSKELRAIFCDINHQIITEALSKCMTEPWKLELALNLYLPHTASKRICSIFNIIKRTISLR